MEAIVAISVVTIVMSALTALLVTVTQVTDHQRDEQTAARITVASLDRVRAIGAAGAVSGRDLSSATAQFDWAPATADHPATATDVAPWLADMSIAADTASSAGSGSSAAVPTSAVAQVVNGRTFWISYFVGYCWRAAGTADGACVKTQTDGAVQYVRVVVAVGWTGGSCGTAWCDYVSATMLDGTGDPVFNFNQAAPTAPQLVTVPGQSSVVAEAVDGVQGISGCADPCAISASDGAPPMIFAASGLPPGLGMDSNGLITGTATTKGTYSVTVTVTDAFLNTATETFAWTVVDSKLHFDAPSDRSDDAGSSVSLAMTGAAGGVGPPYTWSIGGQPAGVNINASTGVISGKLATNAASATPYQVTVTLADSTGAGSVSHTFAWTVAPVLTIAAPSPVPPTSVGGTVSTQASFTCPNAPCTFSATGLPSGVGLGTVTGTTSGTVALSGKVSGSAQTYSAQLTITDSKGAKATAPFSWPVVAAPSITNPGSQNTWNSKSSKTYSIGLSSSCPLGGCTFAAAATRGGTPVSNVSVDSTGTVTVAGPSKTTYTITVTITDADGASSSTTFTWTFS
ncbi:MAG TPA: Ig domain-containing protein [Jatrophihabitantaceae bacterium]|nr:Ig domain-containing protein [Jatrophihabitantaceae bacterium]